LQYKNRKNLYKILFVTILLGFIISLVGCNWLSLGLLNIFDPQAQIRVNYTDIDLTDGEGTIALEVYSLNEVEFIGSGFSYKYYSNNVLISDLTKTVGATFYVEPSTSPGTPGPTTTIDLPLYYQEAQDYATSNPLITEITCTISLIGTDGAGHNITKSVTFDLPALQPGIDFEPPVAVINVTPGTTGTAPFTVVFDASSSTDDRGIASYAWDFGDGTTATGVMPAAHIYTGCGSYIVKLTVTDYWGNKDYATVIINVGETEGPNAVITVTPSTTGTAPFTVYLDASQSSVAGGEEGCGSCSIVSYSWNFGDGSTGTGVTLNHTYSNVGTYTVVLTVTDSNGKKGYDSKNIKVEKAPSAVINTTPTAVNGIVSGNFPFTVYFDAYESTSESGIVSYAWSFGDGSTATGITTNHTYSTSGTYIVYLTITDSNGYEAYDSVIVSEPTVEATVTAEPDIISPPPGNSTITAFFAYSTGIPVPNGTTVNFTKTGAAGATLSVSSDTTTNGYATTTLTMTSVGVVVVKAETIYASGTVTVTCVAAE